MEGVFDFITHLPVHPKLSKILQQTFTGLLLLMSTLREITLCLTLVSGCSYSIIL